MYVEQKWLSIPDCVCTTQLESPGVVQATKWILTAFWHPTQGGLWQWCSDPGAVLTFNIKRFLPPRVGNSDTKGANEGGEFDRSNFQMSESPGFAYGRTLVISHWLVHYILAPLCQGVNVTPGHCQNPHVVCQTVGLHIDLCMAKLLSYIYISKTVKNPLKWPPAPSLTGKSGTHPCSPVWKWPPILWQNTDFSAQNDPFFVVIHWMNPPFQGKTLDIKINPFFSKFT